MPRPTAANAIWPYLRDDADPSKQQEQRASLLAQSMWPTLMPKQRSPESIKLSRDLQELARKIDARLAREGKR